MQVLIINLAEEKARRDFQKVQMQSLGLNFHFVEAVSASSLDPDEDLEYWNSWERSLRLSERACLRSHFELWKCIGAGTEPVLILEDDALLAQETTTLLPEIERLSGVDHVNLETRGRRKLVGRKLFKVGSDGQMRRLYQDRSGSAAYILFPAGARKLVAFAERRAGTADAVICAAYDLMSYQLDPAMAIQLDQCVAFGIPTPVRTSSSIGSEPRPQKQTLRQASRRVGAQLRMLGRQLSVLGLADRRMVKLSPSFQQNFVNRITCAKPE